MANSPTHSESDLSLRDSPDNGGRLPSPINRMLRVRSSTRMVTQPDTEDQVRDESEAVFLNYVYQSYRNDSVRNEVDSTPAAPEILSLNAAPLMPGAEIGRQLARLGDEINEKYADVFDGMIGNLNLSSDDDSTYDAFACIARRVFSDGISWSRVLFLLSFGYRMAITTLRTQASNFASFLTRIATFVTRFLVVEKITNWIADHGGWSGALSYIPDASTPAFLLISTLAALSVFAVVAYHRFVH